MDAKQKAFFKEKIIQEIKITKAKIAELEEITQPIAPENAIGRVSRMDAINNKSVNEAALRTAKSKMDKLELALRKADEANFGKCLRCGQEIPEGRLMIMPESTKCVRCAS